MGIRLVVKVGTSTLTRDNGSINLRSVDLLARTLSDLHGQGNQIILVSSGAIGVGVGKLGLEKKPDQLRMKQAAAAVGQCELLHLYDKFFGEYGPTVAQILLTDEDVEHPVRAEHLTNTFSALLELGCIPIVNENDSVSSAEIETGRCKVLGDNDTLSAIVARLVRADLLVLLSDIEGLYDRDPHQDPDARLIHRVRAVTPELRASAGGAGTRVLNIKKLFDCKHLNLFVVLVSHGPCVIIAKLSNLNFVRLSYEATSRVNEITQSESNGK